MRVLVVNAFAHSSSHGRKRFDEFRAHVHRVIKAIERQEVTQIDIIEKTRHDLDELLFEMHSEFAEPSCITNFDRLDFVFVAGDPSASPWAPAMRKLVLLTKMCMMTGKCFYGSGLGAGLVAFLCSTAGEHLRVVNNDGKGSHIENVQAVAPPWPLSSGGSGQAHGTDVLLDTCKGDFFTFEAREHAWVPQGNTGLMHHTSDHAHDYGARVNTARAGTKTHRSELSHALYVSKRGDTKCCCRLEASSHALFQTRRSPLSPRSSSSSSTAAAAWSREFLVSCNSKWDIDDHINATGNNKYRVLIDSSRGPMLIEFGNCVGTHFGLTKEYPESLKLLHNFVISKFEAFKVHEHIDRSYVSAISGSSRLKDRLQLAQTKTSTTAALASARESYSNSNNSNNAPAHLETPPHTVTMTSGKTSPKRCRPVSAGPYRTVVKPVEAVRIIQTSRSVYPSTSGDPLEEELRTGREQTVGKRQTAFSPRSTPRQAANVTTTVANNQSESSHSRAPSTRPQTARACVRTVKSPQELQPEVESPATETEEEDSLPTPASTSPRVLLQQHRPQRGKAPIKAHRRIRIAQRNELDKPYCAIDKFNALRTSEKAQNKDMYYSVVNDAPYVSGIEQEQLAYQQSKLKWIGGPFQTAIGKASTQITPEPSVFTRAPFIQKNTPFHIIQRRELDAPPPLVRQPPGPAHQDTEKPHTASRTGRAASAPATRRTVVSHNTL